MTTSLLYLISALGSPAALTQPVPAATCGGTYAAPTVVVFDAACATPSMDAVLYLGDSEEPTPVRGVGRLASGRLVVYVNPQEVEL